MALRVDVLPSQNSNRKNKQRHTTMGTVDAAVGGYRWCDVVMGERKSSGNSDSNVLRIENTVGGFNTPTVALVIVFGCVAAHRTLGPCSLSRNKKMLRLTHRRARLRRTVDKLTREGFQIVLATGKSCSSFVFVVLYISHNGAARGEIMTADSFDGPGGLGKKGRVCSGWRCYACGGT